MVFVRKCKDRKNRQDESLSDSDLCGVTLEVLQFMKDKKAPRMLQQTYLQELMKVYEVNTVSELLKRLKEKRDVGKDQDNMKAQETADSQDENENDNGNENRNDNDTLMA